jgi:hypothetical protein
VGSCPPWYDPGGPPVNPCCPNPPSYSTYTYSEVGRHRLANHQLDSVGDVETSVIGLSLWWNNDLYNGQEPLDVLQWRLSSVFSANYSITFQSNQYSQYSNDGGFGDPESWSNINLTYSIDFIAEIQDTGAISLKDPMGVGNTGKIIIEWHPVAPTGWNAYVVLEDEITVTTLSANYQYISDYTAQGIYKQAFPVLLWDGYHFDRWVYSYTLNKNGEGLLQYFHDLNDTAHSLPTPFGNTLRLDHHKSGGHAARYMARCISIHSDYDLPGNYSTYAIDCQYYGPNDVIPDSKLPVVTYPLGRRSKELLFAVNQFQLKIVPSIDSFAYWWDTIGFFSELTANYNTDSDLLIGMERYNFGLDPDVLPVNKFYYGFVKLCDFGVIQIATEESNVSEE